ncbi:MAG: hypothetical protein Q7J68_04125, partial [Thermoplasmata archaeon]|nr:hypothetical protein [Thermoplasmata archaeon]
ILAPPISFINNHHVSNADIVFSTVYFDKNGQESAGRMFSYSSAGRMAPTDNSIPGFDLLTISIATITALAIVKVRRKRQ